MLQSNEKSLQRWLEHELEVMVNVHEVRHEYEKQSEVYVAFRRFSFVSRIRTRAYLYVPCTNANLDIFLNSRLGELHWQRSWLF